MININKFNVLIIIIFVVMLMGYLVLDKKNVNIKENFASDSGANIDKDSRIYDFGLSNERGVVTFYSCPNDADSSIIEPPKYEKCIDIKVERLDELILNTSIKFLKLEAEGAELEVLEGARKILHNIEYIAADLGYERGVLMESTFLNVTNYLLKRNFILIEFDFNRMTFLYKNNN